jgi:DNA-binding MarR family transcriptional regulator
MNPRILYMIKRLEIEQTSRMTTALQQFDLSPIQFAILYFVDYDSGDLSSAQLSRRFLMTPQSMNEHVRVLERKKLLKKKTDPSHKKILRIALTAKGNQILEACNRELDIMEGKFLTGLSSKEIETMKNLIGKILNSLREDAS